jgi:hypothetical protein
MRTVIEMPSLAEKLRAIRTERYAAQSVARLALPNERVSKCLRLTLSHGEVEVWKHLKTEKSFYNNLLVCGSVWTCPICAAKISERRKEEITKAFDLHKIEGGKIALLTLTFSHKKTDRLKDTLVKFLKASSDFRSGKRYQRIREEMKLIGSIRVFEITHGDNGWHPHIHMALFYSNNVSLSYIKSKMTELWEIALNRQGLTGSEKYRLDLQDGNKAQEYISKHGTWSLEQELSKSHIKKGRENSLTPFDLLRKFIETGESNYINLFKEYAEALKGKSQIFWSRGLKNRFLIEEKTDEILAAEKVEQAELLGQIPWDIWKIILKRDIRSNFLSWVEKDGFESAFKRLLKEKETSLDEVSLIV